MRPIEMVKALLASDEDRNQQWLAEELGVSQGTVSRWLGGSDPRGESRDAIRDLYTKFIVKAGARPRITVPVMGYLGAGGEVDPVYEQVPAEGLDAVEVPFPLPAEMIAFTVRGTSMLPAYKPGATIIVYAEQRKPIDAFYGHEAAVRTTDGRRYIKTVMRGTQPGTVNLSSFNAMPIEDQQIEWIGEIFVVMPPAALGHMARTFR